MTAVAHRRVRLPGESEFSAPPVPRDGQRVAFVFDSGKRYTMHVGTFLGRGVYTDRGSKIARWSNRIAAWAPIGEPPPSDLPRQDYQWTGCR